MNWFLFISRFFILFFFLMIPIIYLNSFNNNTIYGQQLQIEEETANVVENDVEELIIKGNTFYDLGNYTAAIEYYDKALAISPNHADALLNKGSALFTLGNNEEAIQYYDKALAISPNNVNALNGKALVYGQTQQQPQQREPFFILMKLNNPKETTPDQINYDVYNMTTNLKNFGQSENKKVYYNLEDIDVTVTDSTTYWTLPIKIVEIDAESPNIIKTTNRYIETGLLTQDYEMQFDTLTNITTYLGKIGLFIGNEQILDNLHLNVTIFPNNSTGILKMTEE